MDSLYPPGLDENRAVDDFYPASWICSEIIGKHFVQCSRLIKCSVQILVAGTKSDHSSAMYKIYNFKRPKTDKMH